MMEGCNYFEDDRSCEDCEHYDGGECMSGEKLVTGSDFIASYIERNNTLTLR